ncbi:hypothetical protein KUTeg_022056 [Tegillarca granosa]|uniref:Uncharacterized protein n=1 Tax=Tegillarca granosa TaxID=220873 RepID=A0ABQ9EAF7_TEGGR|nr:hypothetical protein KUTeg_022056 [Tegillarca granosa]
MKESVSYNVTVEKRGLVVGKENFYLGASVVGIVTIDGTRYTLELKNPLSTWDLNLPKAAAKLQCLKVDENQAISLNRRHSYYIQIQGQMTILNIHRCYFVLCTKTDIHVELIEFDAKLRFLDFGFVFEILQLGAEMDISIMKYSGKNKVHLCQVFCDNICSGLRLLLNMGKCWELPRTCGSHDQGVAIYTDSEVSIGALSLISHSVDTSISEATSLMSNGNSTFPVLLNTFLLALVAESKASEYFLARMLLLVVRLGVSVRNGIFLLIHVFNIRICINDQSITPIKYLGYLTRSSDPCIPSSDGYSSFNRREFNINKFSVFVQVLNNKNGNLKSITIFIGNINAHLQRTRQTSQGQQGR